MAGTHDLSPTMTVATASRRATAGDPAGSMGAFWALPAADILRRLESSAEGLASSEAQRRLDEHGSNRLKPKERSDALALLARQFTNPLTLILLAAALLSFFLHDRTDAGIILAIVMLSGMLGFWQERGAADVVEKLLSIVQTTVTVVRDGAPRQVPLEEVVPGDIIVLSAGDAIAGDALLLECKDLFVDEAVLTGETYPVEKLPGVLGAETPLAQRTNALFQGTHVVSGSTRAVVVHTGPGTEFGKISQRLKLRPPLTEFERGVRRFGAFLLEVTAILIIAIFAVNVYLARPVLDSFLFSLALAVGLTPQLLPAIISINLAFGAKRMASQKVIVKRLSSIENLGSMTVLCSDKTGTLTEGAVHLHSAVDPEGRASEKVLRYAHLNAVLQSGFVNPIDEGIRASGRFDISEVRKLDEIPYDFIRKRLSVLVSRDSRSLLITKGAVDNVLGICSTAERADGSVAGIPASGGEIRRLFAELSEQGFRTLGVAYRDLGDGAVVTRDDERDMTFLGFLILDDPPKGGIADTVRRLRELGVSLKVITGDNRLVAASLGRQVGLQNPRILTGAALSQMSDEALPARVDEVDLFAEIEPNQKERIILALRKAGHVVGYIGDGINDASALHAADVGISVNSAVDVAKEAADIVLLEYDLGVLVQGVREGRVTFANTLKYVFMATSANFGNMFSMAGASLFLPFLPLLPKQILLTNLLTDFPEITIATDTVDPEMVDRPRRWDSGFIRRFMVTFGILSSVFDFLTFGALLLILHASVAQFRTAWFVESVASASLIVLVIRSRRPFFRNSPSRKLLAVTLLIVGLTFLLPYTSLARLFGLTPLPPLFFLAIGIIVGLYIGLAETGKSIFYRREQ